MTALARESTASTEIRLKIRFLLAGLWNTVCGYAFFAGLLLLLEDRLPYVAILVASHVASVLQAYLVDALLVLRAGLRPLSQVVRFSDVYVVALGLNLVLLPLLVEVAHLPVLPAQALALGLIAVGSFAGHRYYSFGSAPTTPRSTS